MDRAIRRSPKKLWLRVGLIVTGVAVVLGTASALLNDSSTSTLRVARDQLSIATVTRGAYQDFIPIRGFVVAERTVYLDSIEGGRVEEIYIEEGNTVSAGTPLLRLSNTALELEVIAREADVTEQINNLLDTNLQIERDRLENEREILEIEYELLRLRRLRDRRKELAARHLISTAELEETQDEFDYQAQQRSAAAAAQKREAALLRQQSQQLSESVNRLKLNLQVTKQKLENLTLRAPVTGQLTKLDAEIGQTKKSGEPLGQIDMIDRLKVTALLDEFYLGRVQVGQHASLAFDGETQQLNVAKVYPGVEDGQFRVDFTFAGALSPKLRTGQTLQLKLQLGENGKPGTNGLLLARGPFYVDTGGSWVFVLDQDGARAQRRPVTLGRTNPQQIEVIAGLEVGERVVVSSYRGLEAVERLVVEDASH